MSACSVMVMDFGCSNPKLKPLSLLIEHITKLRLMNNSILTLSPIKLDSKTKQSDRSSINSNYSAPMLRTTPEKNNSSKLEACSQETLFSIMRAHAGLSSILLEWAISKHTQTD